MARQHKAVTVPYPDWVLAFGQRLERARGTMGLTQADLAGRELSKSFVSLLETGRSYPSVETLMLLAKRTGSSVGALLLDAGELRLDLALGLAVLAHGVSLTRPDAARALTRTAEEIVPDMPLWLRADLLLIRGRAARGEGRLDEAERLSQEGMASAETARHGPGKARALAQLGSLALAKGNASVAFTLLSDAVVQFRKSSALRSEGGIETLLWQGAGAIKIGRSRFARRVYENALRLATRLALPSLKGQALEGTSLLAWSAGDLAQATRIMRDARATFEASEDLVNLSRVLIHLGVLYREQGELDQALAALQRAIRLKDELADLAGRSAAHQEMARLCLQMGAVEEAAAAARRALQDAEASGDAQRRAQALAALGRVAAHRGDRRRATRYLREAAILHKSLGLAGEWSEVSRDLATLSPGGGGSEAAHYLAQALASPPGQGRQPGRRRKPHKLRENAGGHRSSR